ncbi:MAG: hypothetical protein WA231_16600 [Methylocella sp.]
MSLRWWLGQGLYEKHGVCLERAMGHVFDAESNLEQVRCRQTGIIAKGMRAEDLAAAIQMFHPRSVSLRDLFGRRPATRSRGIGL